MAEFRTKVTDHAIDTGQLHSWATIPETSTQEMFLFGWSSPMVKLLNLLDIRVQRVWLHIEEVQANIELSNQEDALDSKETLEFLWNKVQSTLTDLEDKYDKHVHEIDGIDALEVKVYTVSKKLERKISALQNIKEDTPKRQRPTLPYFNGSPKAWPMFFEQFTKIIHNRKDISDKTKLLYLQMYVKGEDVQMISNFAMGVGNYKLAWDCLCRRYKRYLPVDKELLKNDDEGSIRNYVSTSDNSDEVTADEMLASQAALDAIVFKKWDFNPPASPHMGRYITESTEQENKLQVVTTKTKQGEDKRSIKKIWAPPTPTLDSEGIEDEDKNGISATTSTSTLSIAEDTTTDIQLEVRPMDDISTVGSTTEEQTSAETATAAGCAAEENSDNTDSNSPVMTTAALPTMETKTASTIASERDSIGSSSNILKETTIITTSESISILKHQDQTKDIYHLEALASATMKRLTTSSTDALSYTNVTNDDTQKPRMFFKEARLHLAWEPPPKQKSKVLVAHSVYLDVTLSGPRRMFRHEHKDWIGNNSHTWPPAECSGMNI